MMAIPRPEYPRPQLVRADWMNLNGEWEFQIDNEKCGEFKEYFNKEHLEGKIIVPFCPESELSGVNNKDFMNCVWYKKKLELTPAQLEKHVILHFGAVDYHAILFVNGSKVGEHKGGYTSFCFDITKFVKTGENDITLCAYDDVRSCNQPAGKQCQQLKSMGCSYTRTTGIWQTVWAEFADAARILAVNYQYDTANKGVVVTVKTTPEAMGAVLSANVLWENATVGSCETAISGNTITFAIGLSEIHEWAVGEGNLYDITFELTQNGEVKDRAASYFGLRTVGLDKKAFLLNGKKVFGRWVLDQGFYPDGIYTAPTDEALKNDILYSMQLGFNGARLHEKVFEPRFLYWADKLGYMVWGEQANWCQDISAYAQLENFLPEWLEAVQRDIAHPAIIGWCPFNETQLDQCDMLVKTVYEVTKAVDPTRPVIDTSGWCHVVTDIFDVHDYEQDVATFTANYAQAGEGIIKDHMFRWNPERQSYKGEPIFVSEYGGIKWTDEGGDAWGYGVGPETEEEFLARYEGLTHSLLDNPDIMAFCYTQLYDIEQEQNGLMTYNRKFKFDPAIIKRINEKQAAIEKE